MSRETVGSVVVKGLVIKRHLFKIDVSGRRNTLRPSRRQGKKGITRTDREKKKGKKDIGEWGKGEKPPKGKSSPGPASLNATQRFRGKTAVELKKKKPQKKGNGPGWSNRP